MNNSLVKSHFSLLVIANSANIFAYLFQFIMGRFLDVSGFGILNAINAFAVIFTMFFAAVPYLVSKYLIRYQKKTALSQSIFILINNITFLSVVFLAITFWIFQDYLLKIFNLSDRLPIIFMLLFMTSGVMLNTSMGVLQGMTRYVEYSYTGSLLQFIKLLAGIILVIFLGYGYNGALLAGVVSNFILWFWVYKKIRFRFPFYINKKLIIHNKIKKKILLDSIPVASTLFLFAFLSNIDVLIVQYYLDKSVAGEYAAASILSKIAIFLPSILLAVLYPQIIAEKANSSVSVKIFIQILLITAFIVSIFCCITYIFGEAIVALLFGMKYVLAGQYLPLISIAMGILAIANVFFNYFLAKGTYGFLWISYIAIIPMGITIIVWLHASVYDIIQSILVGSAILLVMNGVYYFLTLNKETR